MVHLNVTVSQVPLTGAVARENALIFSVIVPRHRPPTDGYGGVKDRRKRGRTEISLVSFLRRFLDVLRDGNSSVGFYAG